MKNDPQLSSRKLSSEISSQAALAFDVTETLIVCEIYDLALGRPYARAALYGEEITPLKAKDDILWLADSALQGFSVPYSDVKKVGICAETKLAFALGELSAEEMYLDPDTEIYFSPFISMNLSGRFTASLLTVPEKNFIAADLGSRLCIAENDGEKLRCAAFELSGAFSAAALESGIAAESGAIDAVRRDVDKTLVYEVEGDSESIGISPAGALSAAFLMKKEGIIDPDGIMTDRDLFYIGEDFFISQSDIRAVQADKAACAAAFTLFRQGKIFLSGEPFSCEAGFKALLGLGALPEICAGASYCRNSSIAGLEKCLSNDKFRRLAAEISEKTEDVSEEFYEQFNEKYFDFMTF